MDHLKDLSRNDLKRLVQGLIRKLQEADGKNKTLLWTCGALTDKLGGSVRITKEEMEELLTTKRLQSHEERGTGDLIVELVDQNTEDPACSSPNCNLRQSKHTGVRHPFTKG